MKLGDKVRVTKVGNVGRSFRNKIGTVAADNKPGETVFVHFGDEAVNEQFDERDLELITDQNVQGKFAVRRSSQS
jgi:hypothetical protein